ncbi:hypothetical protein VZQ01_27140 [Myxococcus faecalis]|uniref:hypothetical protein n=1 Tax=Myxococcus TaxID=32 RepID=UPI001CC00CA0|nr:hypothetical protein [Myxococcus sp. XM-1-1-1]MBZ4413734.1 hypothetical protein [Myxococcus sp. XM-1-1-1]
MAFFESTSGAQKNLVELFDFVWPTAAAMWNLRWQVSGYLQALPSAPQESLMGRFVEGSGIQGVNLRKTCLDQTWESQQEEFARFALINTIATFEAWLRQTLRTLGADTKENEKELQFPTETTKAKTRGVQNAIDRITTSESNLIKGVFYPLLRQNRKYATGHLESLLICYRYFKELRNSLIHHGGEADKKAEEAYAAFAAIATPSQLHVAEVPKHHAVYSGTPIKLDLRGVAGFSDIIIKIITTLDAELARAESAELELKKRILKVSKTKHQLSSDKNKRHQQLLGLTRKLGLPKPTSTIEFETFLRSHNLAS